MESLPNSTNALDQMMHMMNVTEKIAEMKAQLNFICNEDISSNFQNETFFSSLNIRSLIALATIHKNIFFTNAAINFTY